ncbi:TPA: addiction module toxin RelE [Candidatus Woesearchaeota archaeon]|nr:addiction module toxin RelE [Candidatus Woesearchaeota archaeon]HIH31984.1 addiction module toxin RelE [Candidatus Woesearchaeota archaeon]HIJ01091.1 addiction module toxin RelE [Candidatus Woesearchaeota archaeon]HIJ13233.1 addiction module toxin RelE [Candidatus Woesearchaeota archaeon]
MYRRQISDKLLKILRKLLNNDKTRYSAALNKISEIMSSENFNHYKNLNHDMKSFKRMHIDSHFVLIFNVDEENKQILFEDLQHYDAAYKRWF